MGENKINIDEKMYRDLITEKSNYKSFNKMVMIAIRAYRNNANLLGDSERKILEEICDDIEKTERICLLKEVSENA